MALKKAVEQENGAVAEYWRIENVTWDYPSSGHLMVAGYINETVAKTAGKSSLDAKIISFPICSEPLSRAQAYAALKDKPEFSGAEDC